MSLLADPRHVLIVDDSAVVRASLRQALRSTDLSILEADSVASAARVDVDSVACALLDFELGDGTGLDVARALRARNARLPVAFFTSLTDAAIRHALTAYGPCFSKPEELRQAVAWIHEHLCPSP